jgi:hypothetical protein
MTYTKNAKITYDIFNRYILGGFIFVFLLVLVFFLIGELVVNDSCDNVLLFISIMGFVISILVSQMIYMKISKWDKDIETLNDEDVKDRELLAMLTKRRDLEKETNTNADNTDAEITHINRRLAIPMKEKLKVIPRSIY